MAKLDKISDERLAEVVKGSSSYRQVCIALDLKGGSIFPVVVERIKRLNLDTTHFTGMAWSKGKTKETHPSLKKKVKLFLKTGKERNRLNP